MNGTEDTMIALTPSGIVDGVKDDLMITAEETMILGVATLVQTGVEEASILGAVATVQTGVEDASILGAVATVQTGVEASIIAGFTNQTQIDNILQAAGVDMGTCTLSFPSLTHAHTHAHTHSHTLTHTRYTRYCLLQRNIDQCWITGSSRCEQSNPSSSEQVRHDVVCHVSNVTYAATLEHDGDLRLRRSVQRDNAR